MQDAIKSLKAPTKKWLSGLRKTYQLEEHTERLLVAACVQWDRAQAARAGLDKHGLLFKDRWGQPRPNPLLEVEQKALALFARLVRESGIDLDREPPPESRLPRQYGG